MSDIIARVDFGKFVEAAERNPLFDIGNVLYMTRHYYAKPEDSERDIREAARMVFDILLDLNVMYIYSRKPTGSCITTV